MNLSAVILAGGKSSRMGRDKAWIELDGQPLLFRAVACARAAGIEEVLVSGRKEGDYSAADCPVVFDPEPECGPLGGIMAALQAVHSQLLLVLAVDLPGMNAAFLRELAARCDELTGAVPRLQGQLEPLAAIYPARCHAIALDLMQQGRHVARDFAEACLREHAVREFSVSASDAACFSNCNTPADLAASRRGAGRKPRTGQRIENL